MSRNRTLTWDLFLTEALPDRLVESGVGNDQVTAVVDDVQRRARDYADGGRASRRALRVPFLDDVASFLPAEAPIGVKADTTVVVRNSLLEDAHAEGPVDDEMLAS